MRVRYRATTIPRAIGALARYFARPIRRSSSSERLAAALATLSDAQRTVVLLHDVEGWGHREIGALLGVAEGTSRSSLHAARRRLRAQLAPADERATARAAG